MATVPQDLIDYLVAMISPPEPHPKAVFWDGLADNLEREDGMGGIAYYKDNVLTGIVLRPASKSEPTEAQSRELIRILRPGAHLLVVAPDDQPTGHTAVCIAEDVGFQVRDAMCWANADGDGGSFHYVPKAVRSQREAGCQGLPTKKGFETLNRKEGSAGVHNPAAGTNRTAGTVANHHPCVKPIKLMVRLLNDIPHDNGPVVDPFCGSGSTAIACIKTGHSFVGIDKEMEYSVISAARVSHWKDVMLKGDKWSECEIHANGLFVNRSLSVKASSPIELLFG